MTEAVRFSPMSHTPLVVHRQTKKVPWFLSLYYQ